MNYRGFEVLGPLVKCRGSLCDLIIFIISRYYGIDANRLPSLDRRGVICEARMLAEHFCWYYTIESSAEVGKIFKRHHSSVCYADKTLRGRLRVGERALCSKYLEIKNRIEEAIKIFYPEDFELRQTDIRWYRPKMNAA